VRTGDDAFPDIAEFPEHQSCLNCHRVQFFARQRPAPVICSNCHINVTPVNTARYSFPSLGEKFFTTERGKDFVSDFRVFFPHDKHLDAISRTERQPAPVFLKASLRTTLVQDSDPKSCAVCHLTYQAQAKSDDEFVTKPPADLGDRFWLKKGTFKTRPTTHAACFTCHNQESELAPLPQNCGDCHKPPVGNKNPVDFDAKLAKTIGIEDWWTLTAWRGRLSAGAFRHEAHGELRCTNCHDPARMNTVNVTSLKVPVKSCGGAEGCHITATADEGGLLHYEIDQKKGKASFACVKCHLVFGSQAVPASHLAVIAKGH